MRHPLSKHFSLLTIATAIAVVCLVENIVAPVPGFVPVLMTLLALAGVFGFRAAIAAIDPLARSANTDHSKPPLATLDFANEGILILNPDMRVIYSNRAFRQLFQVPEAFLAREPGFAAIVDFCQKAGIYSAEPGGAEPAAILRIEAVTSGANAPAMVRLADGTTLRFSCSILPDGGRMLSYSNISDLMNDAERLEELAHIDSMTGLINRRRFFDIATREWNMSSRYGRMLSVLMLDIDHFKAVNDTHGHDIGDEAIRYVATICHESKRGTDTVARIGGEEFALLLPETDLQGARILAERIRSRVAANPLTVNGVTLRLSVSLGVAERIEATSDFNALLKCSDKRLYSAKRAGRNLVVHQELPVREEPAPMAIAR